ncbi:MAG: response regulator transcription factor [Spirochaetales bacterium]|nr:response regulator transcription factor [Spirochaetales bacterium]
MKILLVDDEKEIITILKNYFEANGHIAIPAETGKSALKLFNENKFDVIVLDIMLPDIDGTEVCRIIRSTSDIPILVLSAKVGDIDQILALGLGADEYAIKPFSPSVILAKLNALHRRYEGIKDSVSNFANETQQILESGSIYLDLNAHIVIVDNQEVYLAPKEFELLYYLMKDEGRVFTKEILFDSIWGEEYGDITTVTVHIRKIREKLEIDPSNPKCIQTVWGIGYKFNGKN